MEEIHRICVPEAEVLIIVPHFSNPLAHSDPTHVRVLVFIPCFISATMSINRKEKCQISIQARDTL